LRAFKGQAVFDLVEGLLDPIPALMLGLGVLGDALTMGTDPGAPKAIFSSIYATFIVTELSSHRISSFL